MTSCNIRYFVTEIEKLRATHPNAEFKEWQPGLVNETGVPMMRTLRLDTPGGSVTWFEHPIAGKAVCVTHLDVPVGEYRALGATHPSGEYMNHMGMKYFRLPLEDGADGDVIYFFSDDADGNIGGTRDAP